MTFLDKLKNTFRPRIVVETYHVKKTNWQEKRDATCRQLAKECGIRGKW